MENVIGGLSRFLVKALGFPLSYRVILCFPQNFPWNPVDVYVFDGLLQSALTKLSVNHALFEKDIYVVSLVLHLRWIPVVFTYCEQPQDVVGKSTKTYVCRYTVLHLAWSF